MTRITDRLFAKIADVSTQTGAFAKVADNLLSRIAPKETASGSSCGPWQYYGCCGLSAARYRRSCFSGPNATTEYMCSGRCFF
ncbi:MAG: hypothetical protein GFH27_549287n300 [Chloroflexi bacterium AL-W]|nr:hypothetical protein [Chloroflexi bacterium AL-N1]NOK66574.1 hypothetical protein [Chloroflexi bacterium AL-N10]NOK71962.1 hypothetical protein [Chloroflexi bacterium AL-N5]NOK81219.1 hypothetical protein [Chloroflexi bacterium AL-W]NOK89492.1 hypothetical protein [Chloroflexi bacterium AL-N15]